MSESGEEMNEDEEDKDEMKKFNLNMEKISTYLEKLNLSDFIIILQSPKKLIYLNFISGLARGFGMAFGMTVLFALFIYIMSKLVGLPVVGSFIAKIVKIITIELKK